MFLFLSKLLPLLVYPLGVALLLMVAALILLWKRPRWAAGAIVAAGLILVISGNGAVASAMMRSLEWRYLPPPSLPQAEAIVVLGGAIKTQEPPRPWIDVTEQGDRVLHGAMLYLDQKAPLLILSGGRITWGDDQEGSEAEDMAQLALALGVPESDIVIEPDSLNTRQNAVNVQAILNERELQRVLLVTSALHMPRALAVFQKLGVDAIPAPTDFHVTMASSPGQDTLAGTLLGLIPNAENIDNFTRSLKEYIGTAVYRLRGWV
jgi:uncharacterized SAM-binding protein YcdF (DUF218 family)